MSARCSRAGVRSSCAAPRGCAGRWLRRLGFKVTNRARRRDRGELTEALTEACTCGSCWRGAAVESGKPRGTARVVDHPLVRGTAMAKHRYHYLFLSSLAVVVFLAGQCRSPTVTSEDLDALLLGRLIPGDPVGLRISIESAVAGTRFENQWAINSPCRSLLNIFLIDSTYSRVATHRYIHVFRQNAVFIRRLHAIVVDSQFIQTLGDKYFATDFNMGIRSTLVSWIIGHEIGHLMRGHRTSHFTPNDMISIGSKRRRRASEMREDEADAYFADIIRANGESMVYTYAAVFSDIVAYEADPNNVLGSTGKPLHSHPAYLVRAFRFLARIVERDKDPELADLIEEWGRELGL